MKALETHSLRLNHIGKRTTLVALFGALVIVLFLATSLASAAAPVYPPVAPLPNGFQPEGIAIGEGHHFFSGSLATGSIYKGDLRTGAGAILVTPQEGRVAVGMAFDPRTGYLFVAGGPTGQAYVYNGSTGANVEEFQLAAPGMFINDVIVTRQAAYFTNSFAPYLYKVPLNADGTLPDPATFEPIMVIGDYQQAPAGFNINGIDTTPNGKWLVIVQSVTGKLFRVNPDSGYAHEIDLGGANVVNGDGILLDGKTLYVVQNANNQIAEIALDPELTTGEIVDTLTDYPFRVPTTIAEFGHYLYAVNARFDVTPDQNTEYEIVQVLKH
jgi:streptogramin lyase